MENLIVNWILPGLIVTSLLGIIAVIVFGIVDYNSPEFCLKKDAWTCTKQHTKQSIAYTLVGKVAVPVYYNETICDQWSK